MSRRAVQPTNVPPCSVHLRILRHLLFLLLLIPPLFSAAPTPPVYAQSVPQTANANGWVFSPVVAKGEKGFSIVNLARVGDNGTVVVYGARNDVTGLYIVAGDVVTTVVVAGTVLPGNLGTVDAVSPNDFDVDPENRILFRAFVSGGALPAPANVDKIPAFRWEDGVITHMLPSGSRVAHSPSRMTSKGEWLAQSYAGADHDSQKQYLLTDGAVITPLLSFNEFLGCTSNRADDFGAANAQAQFLYLSRHYERAPIQGDDGCQPDISDDWSLSLVSGGTTSVTIASGAKSTVGVHTNGAEINQAQYRLNDNGDVIYIKDIYSNEESDVTPTSQQLILRDGSGEQVLLDHAPYLTLGGFDNAKRVAFSLIGNGISVYAGPNLVSDRVFSLGESLFGETTTSITLLDVSEPPASFGDKRIFVVLYEVEGGGEGIALASKGVTRWINAAGGSWSTAANWLPAEVPGATTETLFDLEGSYEVNVGERQSGRSSVENGSVSFADADLELAGPLTVGDDGSLSLPVGTLQASELTIGALPPLDPAKPPLARFSLLNEGAVFTTTGPTKVGDAGQGELFISGGSMGSSAAEIGGVMPGAVNLGLSTGYWQTENLAIGANVTGTLNIERGAFVRTKGEGVIGQGKSLQSYLASVTADNAGATSVGATGNWSISDTLTIGNNLRGELTLVNGGFVAAFGLVQMGLVGRNDRQNFDAILDVSGVTDDKLSPSFFGALENIVAGLDTGSRSSIHIHNGGRLSTFGLSLAHESGSIAYLTVEGVHTSGIRSKVEAAAVNGAESCAIGYKGRAQLTISDGALFTCVNLLIGQFDQSHGQVMVEGAADNLPSTLEATSLICVGGSGFCGGENGPTGRLTLQNGGVVRAANLVVTSGGVVAGSGQIAVGLMLVNGAVAPGIEIVPALEPLLPDLQTDGIEEITPGELTISGTLTLSNSAVITMDVTGGATFDKLVVTGETELGGKLVLNFSNGYAPRQGETIAFLQSPAIRGDFDEVAIVGLAPGFDFAVTSVAGKTQLLAKNDGVSTTGPDQEEGRLSLPFVLR